MGLQKDAPVSRKCLRAEFTVSTLSSGRNYSQSTVFFVQAPPVLAEHRVLNPSFTPPREGTRPTTSPVGSVPSRGPDCREGFSPVPFSLLPELTFGGYAASRCGCEI